MVLWGAGGSLGWERIWMRRGHVRLSREVGPTFGRLWLL